MNETPASNPPPKGKPTVKKIVIPGDFTGDLNFGTNNKVNGRVLQNPTIPSNAIVTEGEEVVAEGEGLSLADKIKADVQAKLNKAGVGGSTGGVTIGGHTDKKSTILVGDNMRVDTSKKPAGGAIELGTERTVPFKLGKTLSGNFNNQSFDGEWTLKMGADGQPEKKGGQFVYVKTK